MVNITSYIYRYMYVINIFIFILGMPYPYPHNLISLHEMGLNELIVEEMRFKCKRDELRQQMEKWTLAYQEDLAEITTLSNKLDELRAGGPLTFCQSLAFDVSESYLKERDAAYNRMLVRYTNIRRIYKKIHDECINRIDGALN